MTSNLWRAIYIASWQRHSIRDWVAHKIAWFLPRRIVYWAFIRVCGHATTGEYSSQVVPELRAMEALQRWQKP